MTAKEVLDIVRGAIRPYLAFTFPTAVVVIGVIVAFKLLPTAVKFIDRDIGLVIIVTVLTIVTAIVTAATTIMAFYFGERSSKKAE
jgi:chromate transport protein ChrA